METSKTILIVTDVYPPENAVVGRLAQADALALNAQGYSVSVFTTASGLSTLEKKEEEGATIYRTPRIARSDFMRFYLTLWNPRVERDFKKVLAACHPDIVHFHNIHEHLSVRLIGIAKRTGARVVLTAHDVSLFHYGKLIEFLDPENPVCKARWDYHVTAWQQIKRFRKRYNPLRRSIIRRALKKLDALCAVSNALAQALADNGISGAGVLHNGIDPDAWQTAPEAIAAFKQKFNIGQALPIFFGGRLSEAKGGSVMLKAFEIIIQKEPRALLMLVGSKTPYVEQLLAKAGSKGLGEKVMCTGFLSGDELRAAYHVSAFVVVPSVCFDSLPTTGLEAFACKKPVIGPCFGGASDYIENNLSGYLVNPYDIATLAAQSLELLKDTGKSVTFGAAGFQKLLSDFTVKQHTKKMDDLYSTLERR